MVGYREYGFFQGVSTTHHLPPYNPPPTPNPMHLYWQGFSYFKLITGDTTVTINPFRQQDGLSYGSVKAELVLVGDGDVAEAKKTTQGDPFIVSGPGEYEVRGVFVYGIPELDAFGKEAGRTFFVVKAENISIGFLGAMQQKELTEKQLEIVEGVDILCVPVGGGDVLDTHAAVATTNRIEPRIVIPAHCKRKGVKAALATADAFIKEAGAKNIDKDQKLKITSKQLPQEDMHIFVFEDRL